MISYNYKIIFMNLERFNNIKKIPTKDVEKRK